MSIQALLDSMADAENSASGREIELQVSFSKLVIRRLRELNWTQKRLAKEVGKPESFISRILCSDHNWTAQTAGRILFALKTQAEIVESRVIVDDLYLLDSCPLLFAEEESGLASSTAIDFIYKDCYGQETTIPIESPKATTATGEKAFKVVAAGRPAKARP